MISKDYSEETRNRQAEMLANRVKKTLKHLKPKFERMNIGAFRLYDRDIPEIRAVVDWYEGQLVLGEYVREQTEDRIWVETMADVMAQILDLPLEHIHIRRRTTRPKEGDRYQRLAKTDERLEVREGDLRFLVNLDDYLDTGLFLDHRKTRAMIAAQSRDKRFLNLFAYTGSFTAYAAKGGASATTTVDLSPRYLEWAQANMKLNNLDQGGRHEWIAAEVREFLAEAAGKGRRWDLIVLDPPSFSTRMGMEDFDILADHHTLICETLKVLEPGGLLYFSTNHQRFVPDDLDELPRASCKEITKESLPIDFKERTPHRLFRIEKQMP